MNIRYVDIQISKYAIDLFFVRLYVKQSLLIAIKEYFTL